jgi:hypothetical protein
MEICWGGLVFHVMEDGRVALTRCFDFEAEPAACT